MCYSEEDGARRALLFLCNPFKLLHQMPVGAAAVLESGEGGEEEVVGLKRKRKRVPLLALSKSSPPHSAPPPRGPLWERSLFPAGGKDCKETSKKVGPKARGSPRDKQLCVCVCVGVLLGGTGSCGCMLVGLAGTRTSKRQTPFRGPLRRREGAEGRLHASAQDGGWGEKSGVSAKKLGL